MAEQSSASNTAPPSQLTSPTAIKHVINSRLHDPLPQHECTVAIYSHKMGRTEEVSDLPQKEQALLAQLRSGHCHKLETYHNIIDPSVDPLCQKCRQLPQTLEHWLQSCPAT